MNPPCVGRGCRVIKVRSTGLSLGSASSPTRTSPSSVTNSISSRMLGSSVLEVISIKAEFHQRFSSSDCGSVFWIAPLGECPRQPCEPPRVLSALRRRDRPSFYLPQLYFQKSARPQIQFHALARCVGWRSTACSHPALDTPALVLRVFFCREPLVPVVFIRVNQSCAGRTVATVYIPKPPANLGLGIGSPVWTSRGHLAGWK